MLPAPPSLAPGAIRVVGYPLTVSTGMNDPADVVGFTSDGSEYGYCDTIGARSEPATKCDFVRRDGTHHLFGSDDDGGNYIASREKAMRAWVKEQGVSKLDLKGDPATDLARPLKGTWSYTDIVVWVNPVNADGVTTNAVVRLGGAVDQEAVVYPISLAAKVIGGTKFHTAIMNDLSLSPDGTEIAAVGTFFCMEWCNDFDVYRASTGAFASLVYNDTGYQHHKKGEFARAAELFSKAAAADPRARLPAYNLACAWARLGDARTKDALAVAIARDPDVKRRAPADADFASVKSEAWFTTLVAP